MCLSIWEQCYANTEIGEIREGTVKGRCVIGLLARVMRGKNVSMEVKNGLKNSILLPILMYG